ncbi:methyl-accepting chemotaxis protein [Falsiroseomonas sp. E2-1-a20]|uniref:methyl-accepting chemotaxis protein n=1 Tax=Falsiroseomonas sp. E2-1-a20 TaxID=3239300 RepID=UPI003F39747B
MPLPTPRLLPGLKPRLILLALMPAVLAVTLVAGSGIMDALQREAARAEQALDRAERQAALRLAGQENRMLGHASTIAQRSDLAAAVRTGDAAALQALLVPSLAALRAVDPVVDVLEVTDQQGRILMRGHNPGQAGDDKSGLADVARALQGSALSGLTLSPGSGHLAMGAVVPLRQGGPDTAVVGTLRVASRIGPPAATELAQVANTDVLLFSGDRLTGATLPNLAAGDLAPLLAPTPPSLATLGPHGRFNLRTIPLTGLDRQPAGRVVVADNTAAAAAAQRAQLLRDLGIGALVLLLTVPLVLFAARSLAVPLAGLAEAMRRMSGGDLLVAVPGQGRTDEIGAMAAALEVFRAHAEQTRQLESAAAAERTRREHQAKEMERQTRDFGGALSGVMRGLSAAANRMGVASRDMAATAEQTEQRARQTAAHADSSVTDLGSVAAAVEELTASVGEIARQAGGAASAAHSLAGRAERADATMVKLAEAAATISDVARLIGDIAGQTNLLALNATIEAARAGEAGKGFAVVANEVKALAAQTAKATGEISGQIQAIQAAAGEAVDTVRGMANEVQDMGATAAAIAAAVEQQGAATRDIAGNVSTVLDTSRRTVAAMEEAAAAARQARESSTSVQDAANEVSAETATLDAEVDAFMAALRDTTGDRRQYERVPGDGRRLRLHPPGGQPFAGQLRDVSLGGVALEAEGSMPPGLRSGLGLQLELQAGVIVEARIARLDWPTLGLVVRQEAANTRHLQHLLDQLATRKAAA